ncbi:uncharacterized protein LOC141834330 isoform X2 [Curcuma longa]|uniref:uncharacterized protein LOC141834330 isoform X2 n=1 Tax=Curcuma longa TaxID=136217 RepID=UPI003D9ED4AD
MDQKSTVDHFRAGSSTPAMADSFSRGLWSPPMAEAALPAAMNKPPRAATACRTHPNASHFASGSQALAAKKRKRNSEDKTIMTAETGEPKEEDYIHVRAQRGQATNSHSLAERVRREKISQRMKFLQELVPGCSKVTGKAVMLDEIINYVRSLQRQVEFLSMKLAAVNPRMDSSTDQALLSKDRFLQSAIGFSPDLVHAKVHPSRQGLVRSGANAFGRTMSASCLGRTATANGLLQQQLPAAKNSMRNGMIHQSLLGNSVRAFFQRQFGSETQ